MVPSLDPGRLLLVIPLRVESCDGARSLRVTCDEANPQVVKSGDCLAVDFEGDTLELQVEKVTDGLVRVSTNAPAVRVLAKRYGDGEDAETKLLEALTGSVCEARRNAAPLLAHRKDLEALWPNPALPRTAENAKRGDPGLVDRLGGRTSASCP